MTGSAANGSRPSAAVRTFEVVLLGTIAVAIAAKLRLLFLLNINWDEFHFLAAVHEAARGDLSSPLNTFHVRLFGWLRGISGDEIDQILAGRMTMFAFSIATAAYVYATARRVLNRAGALFAVICLLVMSNTIVHGTSFRYDPMLGLLFAFAIYHLAIARKSSGGAAVAGAAMGLALALSIKSVLLLAAVIVVATVAENGNFTRNTATRFGLFALCLLATFTAFVLGHAAALPMPTAASLASLRGTAGKMLIDAGLFPRWHDFKSSLFWNPLLWALLGYGTLRNAWRLLRSSSEWRRRSLLLLALTTSLLPLLVYRNAFPYFYVAVMPTAVIACGVLVSEIVSTYERVGDRRLLWLAISITLAVAANGALHHVIHARDATQGQRQLINVVHRMFPKAVPYIDRCSMIASFPQAGFFMSTWGMETYHARGEPVMAKILKRRAPVFLIANHPALDLDAAAAGDTGRRRPLLATDLEVLRQNYLEHWGPVYVAGKVVSVDRGSPTEFPIMVPGHYTVEGQTEVLLDGQHLAPGEDIELERGNHTLQVLDRPARVTLRWGQRLYRPADTPAAGPLFYPL